MEKKLDINNTESEDLVKIYEKINTFIKFLDSEQEKNNMEEKNE